MWKSNNQGFKEDTFIQTGRRDRDMVWHGEVEVVMVAEWAVPHSLVVNKNWERNLGSKRSQPQARLHSLGFQHQEDKSP